MDLKEVVGETLPPKLMQRMEFEMNQNRLSWYIADNKYVNYLRTFDNKVENIDYEDKVKPYLGILLTINEHDYYVPISSVKEKHYRFKENMDFIKIMKNDKILGVLNLNNMIPISKNNVKLLRYEDIEKYRNFESKSKEKLYISLLDLELNLINKKIDQIKNKAMKVYQTKINAPESNIAKRCCDFKLLEEKCDLYNETLH